MADQKLEHGRKTTPNRIKSMRVHIGLAVFYALIGLLAAAFLLFSKEGRGNISVMSGLVSVAFLMGAHIWISIGASKSNSMAQAASVVAAVLMLPAFPIGTFLGIYLLANAKWSESAMVEEASGHLPPT